jgi:dipeptidase E
MYLSSFGLGDHPERLQSLLPGSGLAAVIANALDAAPDDVRKQEVEQELVALQPLGLEAEELDLRDYFGDQHRLVADMARFTLVWVPGGNVFVLRYALARSGADDLLKALVPRDELVYAGYSAGSCVLAPSLRGLEIVDDPAAVREAFGDAAIWEGLGVLEYAIVPHYRSGHPESEAVEALAAHYRAEGVPHQTLRDGEAIVIDS